MKKSIALHLLLAFMLVSLVSCNKNNGGNDDSCILDIPETEDALSVKTKSRTYVFPYNYEHSASAFEKRITDKAETLDESVKTVMLHDSHAATVGENDLEKIADIVAAGGSLVYCEPTIPNVTIFIKKLKTTISSMRKNGTLKFTSAGQAAYQNIAGMCRSENGFIFSDSNDKDGILCDIIAINGNSSYIITDLDEVNPVETKSVTEGVPSSAVYSKEQAEPTNYLYGLHADALAEWLDNVSEDAENSLPDNGADAQDLEKLTNAQRVSYAFNAYAGHKYEPVTISYEIWAVNDTEGTDYYLVHQEIRCENSKLKCGPEEKDKWNTYKVQEAFSDVKERATRAYWAYMTGVNNQTEFSNDAVVVEHVSPSNDMSGVTEYSQNLDWSLDCAFVMTKTPYAKISGGVKMSKSWTYSIPDLGMTFQYNKNKPKWSYATSTVPDGYIKHAKQCHEFAKPILRNDCTIGHSWIWKIASADNTYSFKTNIGMDLQGLWHNSEVEMKAKWGRKTFSNSNSYNITLNPPPRYEQKWVMELYPYDKTTSDFMMQHFPDYWTPAFSLYTVESDDRDAIDSRIADMKDLLNNNASILKDAGIESFTLKWKLVNDSNIYETYDFSVN